jgi:hypothetical protein
MLVDWGGPAPVLHLLDNGPGFHHVPALPRDMYSESGRGLFIISLLSEEFSVSRRPDYGSHARAVLSLRAARSSARLLTAGCGLRPAADMTGAHR